MKILLGACVGVGLLVTAAGGAEEANHPPPAQASIDLMYRPERHLLTKVALEAEGRTLTGWVVVDTGASFALGLDRDTLMILGSPRVTVRFPGSSLVAAAVPVSEFDDQRVAKVAKKSGKDLGDQKLLGLIGFPFLRGYLVTFDLEQKKIHFRPLASAQRTWAADRPLAEVTYLDQADELFCPVTINQTAQGYLQVDSGLPFGTLLDTRLANALSHVEIGGLEVVKVLQAEDIMPAPFSQGNPFGVKNLYGLMGLNMFRHYLVTIDPTHKKLYFEKTAGGWVPAAGAPWVGIRFGVHEAAPGKVVVARVTKDGPAEQGGLKEDDLVERIEGQPVNTVEEASTTVKKRKPGDLVRFEIKRADTPLQLTITVGHLQP